MGGRAGGGRVHRSPVVVVAPDSGCLVPRSTIPDGKMIYQVALILFRKIFACPAGSLALSLFERSGRKNAFSPMFL